MSAHNIRFYGEVRKKYPRIIIKYSSLINSLYNCLDIKPRKSLFDFMSTVKKIYS